MKINLAQNCVARYKLNDNEDSAVVLDSSGKGYHGITVRNTNLMHTDGKIDGALEFNGTSDYVDTGQTFESFFRDSFTINLWFKIDDGKPPQRNMILHIFQSDSEIGAKSYFNIGVIGDGWLSPTFFPDYDSGIEMGLEYPYTPENPISLPDGPLDWMMVTVSYEKVSSSIVNGKLYINGVLFDSKQWEYTDMAKFTADRNLLIGSSEAAITFTPQYFFDGAIDDVTLFDKILNQEEIDFLYNNGNGRENLYENVTIEEALFDVLSSNIGISDIISTRIFPNSIPQKESLPAIVYQQNSGPRVHNMAGAVGMVKAEYTFASYAESYSQAKALSEVVRNCLDGYSGTVGSIVIDVIMMTDEFDVPNFKAGTDVLKRYGKNLTFEVWYQESIT